MCDKCEELVTNPDIISKIKACLPAENEILRLSEIFKLLGDQTRLKIICALSKAELCVCDIAETVEMSQSAVSHQLRLMRNTKLVKFRKEGKSVYYSLDDEHILELFNQAMEHVKHT